MTQKEKAILMDVAGMIQQLVEENKTPIEQENHSEDEKENNSIGEDEINFVKNLKEDSLLHMTFRGYCADGDVCTGHISTKLLSALLDAFIEKYG